MQNNSFSNANTLVTNEINLNRQNLSTICPANEFTNVIIEPISLLNPDLDANIAPVANLDLTNTLSVIFASSIPPDLIDGVANYLTECYPKLSEDVQAYLAQNVDLSSMMNITPIPEISIDNYGYISVTLPDVIPDLSLCETSCDANDELSINNISMSNPISIAKVAHLVDDSLDNMNDSNIISTDNYDKHEHKVQQTELPQQNNMLVAIAYQYFFKIAREFYLDQELSSGRDFEIRQFGLCVDNGLFDLLDNLDYKSQAIVFALAFSCNENDSYMISDLVSGLASLISKNTTIGKFDLMSQFSDWLSNNRSSKDNTLDKIFNMIYDKSDFATIPPELDQDKMFIRLITEITNTIG